MSVPWDERDVMSLFGLTKGMGRPFPNGSSAKSFGWFVMVPCPLVFDAPWFLSQAKRQRVSHAVIGIALGLERSAATKVLNGNRPMKLDYVPALARLLGVSRAEIIERCGLPLDGDGDTFPQPEVQSHV